MRRAYLLGSITLVLLATTWPRAAAAASCEERLAVVEGQLEREHRRVRRWEIAWTITYAGLTAAQSVALAAEFTPVGEWDEVAEASLHVGITKAALGLGLHVVKPLKVARPGAPTGDACADLAAAEGALATTAAREKKAFFLGHLGNLVVNLAGVVYLGLRHDDWGEGAKTFVLGYPIGVLSSYTQPRGAWHAVRVVAAPGYQGVAIGGEF